jgi:hypothetical protein
MAQIIDGFVHQRLESQDAADGKVLCDGFLHPGVPGRIGHAENVVHNFTADHDAVVVIELGLGRLERSTWPMPNRMATYLAPCLVCAVDDFDQLRAVEIDEVGADAHNRAVLIVEFLDAAVVVTRPHEEEAPKVGPSCMEASMSTSRMAGGTVGGTAWSKHVPARTGPGYRFNGDRAYERAHQPNRVNSGTRPA